VEELLPIAGQLSPKDPLVSTSSLQALQQPSAAARDAVAFAPTESQPAQLHESRGPGGLPRIPLQFEWVWFEEHLKPPGEHQ